MEKQKKRTRIEFAFCNSKWKIEQEKEETNFHALFHSSFWPDVTQLIALLGKLGNVKWLVGYMNWKTKFKTKCSGAQLLICICKFCLDAFKEQMQSEKQVKRIATESIGCRLIQVTFASTSFFFLFSFTPSSSPSSSSPSCSSSSYSYSYSYPYSRWMHKWIFQCTIQLAHPNSSFK